MASHALASAPSTAPVVTTEQLDLILRTVAKDATPDEVKLYLYDCARQGVHPLDKLIHFTKRNGKYTPITSIDFMRIRAADTGEYAGSDDALFEPKPTGQTPETTRPPSSATVTVWRLVQGQRCAFTATARWAEYKPESNDFMWRKMPHTMLAKCAEALALRKGFPRQLAGLYAKEEMEQAENAVPTVVVTPPTTQDVQGNTVNQVTGEVVSEQDGLLRIARVVKSPTSTGKDRWYVHLSDGRRTITFKAQVSSLAEQLCQAQEPVTVTTTEGKWGLDLKTLSRVTPETAHKDDEPPPHVTADSIPF